MALFIGVADKADRARATVYLSNLNPDEVEWDEFEMNRVEFRDKSHRTTSDGNTHMPSDIAIGLLTNILQAAGIPYTRIDI
jgi:hypothetical protein